MIGQVDAQGHILDSALINTLKVHVNNPRMIFIHPDCFHLLQTQGTTYRAYVEVEPPSALGDMKYADGDIIWHLLDGMPLDQAIGAGSNVGVLFNFVV